MAQPPSDVYCFWKERKKDILRADGLQMYVYKQAKGELKNWMKQWDALGLASWSVLHIQY